jgi:Ca2+-binding RTX toxin-like protein
VSNKSLPSLVILTYNNDNNIIGNRGDNVLQGLAGDDTIYAEAGNDIIIGGVGNDTLDGPLSELYPTTPSAKEDGGHC